LSLTYKIGLALFVLFLAGVAFQIWKTPVPGVIKAGLSDSLQVVEILDRMGLVDVDFSRCVRTDTIGGRVRIVSLYLDGRHLPGKDRERTWREKLGKRQAYLTGISNLSELRHLRFQNFAVFDLPEELGLLKKLSDLVVANGKLRRLPDSLGTASALETLNLPNNEISQLPSSVCAMKGLRRLMIAGNRNLRIPPEGCLENLKDLYINRSQLDGVPPHLRDRVSFVAERND